MSKSNYTKIIILLIAFFLSNISKAQLQLDWINKYASTSDSLSGYSSCVDYSNINHVASNGNSIWSIGSFSTNDDIDYYGQFYIDFSQNQNSLWMLSSDYESCYNDYFAQKFIKSINPETIG